MPRPVIGVVAHTLSAVTGERPACWAVGRRYAEALRVAGAVPWVIPPFADPDALAEIFARLDGVMLAGGADVDPGRYGEARHPLCDAPDPDRDAAEVALVRHALARPLPLLAICRGLQLLNVACGGSLYQDVAAQVPAALKHDYFTSPDHPSREHLAHEVTLAPGSKLAALLGDPLVPVNSMHHQAVKDLGAGLRATAFAPDGIVEGVEGDVGFVVAVQWHPEELVDTQPGMRQLFTAFVAACR